MWNNTVAAPSPDGDDDDEGPGDDDPSDDDDEDPPPLEDHPDSDDDEDDEEVAAEETDDLYPYCRPYDARLEVHHLRLLREGPHRGMFPCMRLGCEYKATRTLYTTDESSTGNMHKHVATCYGVDAFMDAKSTGKTADEVRVTGRGNHATPCASQPKRPPSARFVRWCAENGRPWIISEDESFLHLMKDGRPDMYVPSASTVAKDTRAAFELAKDSLV